MRKKNITFDIIKIEILYYKLKSQKMPKSGVRDPFFERKPAWLSDFA